MVDADFYLLIIELLMIKANINAYHGRKYVNVNSNDVDGVYSILMIMAITVILSPNHVYRVGLSRLDALLRMLTCFIRFRYT